MMVLVAVPKMRVAVPVVLVAVPMIGGWLLKPVVASTPRRRKAAYTSPLYDPYDPDEGGL